MEFKYKEDYPSSKALIDELSKLPLEELEEICKREKEKILKELALEDAKEQAEQAKNAHKEKNSK